MYNPLCFCTRSEVLGSLLVTRIMTNKMNSGRGVPDKYS
uniref:Uncharacterized protein n=1 Tax=Anguilla anguilla TaxID=7936 RepID=A0A0E9SJ66_ANGAN